MDGVVYTEATSEDDVDADDHINGNVPEVKRTNLQGGYIKDVEVRITNKCQNCYRGKPAEQIQATKGARKLTKRATRQDKRIKRQRVQQRW